MARCVLQGFLTTASTGEGEDSDEILAIASSPMSSLWNTFSTWRPDDRASRTIFSPSTTNNPDASLYFFVCRDLMSLICLFEIGIWRQVRLFSISENGEHGVRALLRSEKPGADLAVLVPVYEQMLRRRLQAMLDSAVT